MKKLGLAPLVIAAACSGQPGAATHSALNADATAQGFGIGAYSVEQDGARLLDQYGLEIGSMKISTPAEGRRLIQFQMVDGATDEVEVYRPKADGTFFAPIRPETITTAAVADKALAPLFAQYGIRFNVDVENALAPLVPSTVATTTACSGGCSGGVWTCTTPAGCVRSANTSECYSNDGTHTDLGPSSSGSCSAYPGGYTCSNPSQLPATIASDTGVNGTLYVVFGGTTCPTQATLNSMCDSHVGVGNWASAYCIQESPAEKGCLGRKMISQWIASCPRQTCATAGQFDAVPRQDLCYDPGSCTFQQGTVGCTTYH